MKNVPRGMVVLAALASGLLSTTLHGQDEAALLGPVVTITFGDGTTLTTSAETGLSELVALDPGEAVGILLTFPTSLAGQRVEIQAADGGIAESDKSERYIADNGTVAFAFQIGTTPGEYRVTSGAGGAVSTIRLWVPDQGNESMNPGHLIFRRKHKTN